MPIISVGIDADARWNARNSAMPAYTSGVSIGLRLASAAPGTPEGEAYLGIPAGFAPMAREFSRGKRRRSGARKLASQSLHQYLRCLVKNTIKRSRPMTCLMSKRSERHWGHGMAQLSHRPLFGGFSLPVVSVSACLRCDLRTARQVRALCVSPRTCVHQRAQAVRRRFPCGSIRPGLPRRSPSPARISAGP